MRQPEGSSNSSRSSVRESALEGALEARDKGLIVPILVGPAAKIEEIAKASGNSLRDTQIVDTPRSHASAAKSVELVREGQAELLMKGSLHTDELLGAVVARETGLRTGRRISQCVHHGRPYLPQGAHCDGRGD